MTFPVILWVTLLVASAAAQGKKPDAGQLTQEFLALHHQFQNANASDRASLAPGIAKKVEERQQALAELIEENPGEVLRLAIPAAVRGDLPEEIQLMMEDETDLEGTLEVLYECSQESSKLRFGLETAAGKHALHFAKEPPEDLLTGSLVKVHGVRVGNSLALESGSSSVTVQALAATLANTFGEQKTAVILVNFTDNATQPYSVDQARTVVFSTTSNWDMENSLNKTWLTGDVFGWFPIALSSTVCDTNSIVTLGKQAATAAGANLANYSRFVFGFPDNACSWWGLGTVGGNPSTAWINGSFTLKVVGHEMGHNFGLYHSRTAANEYGDTLDIMGNPSSGHFNAFQKERLGWLNYGTQPPITTVQASGDYFIDPFAASGGNPKALKVLKSVDASGYKTWYYVERRTGIGFDSSFASNANVMNGVVIHTGSESTGNSSYLLDMTPETTSFSDPALIGGKSFTDSTAGVTISTVSASGTGATINVSLGTQTCTQASPSLTPVSNQTQYAAAGSTLSFAVTLANNDSSGCGSTTFNLGTAPPAGWVASAGPAPVTLAPGATASITVQVTSPASAASAIYSTTVTATSTANSSKTASASVSYGVSAPACVPANPNLSASQAAAQAVRAGTTVNYSYVLTNSDGAACAAKTFNVNASVPSGWSATVSPISVNLSPGASASVTVSVTSASTAVDGVYIINVTATSSADSSKAAAATVTYSVSNPVCVAANPAVTASSSLGSTVAAGTSVSYTISVKNNDCADCPSKVFNITATAPSGWTVTVSPNPVTLAPGTSVNVTVTINSPATAADGSYNIVITATSSTDAGKTASVTVTYSIATTVVASVATPKASYVVGEKVVITATVTANGSPRSGASVVFTVTKANGAKVSQTLTTGTNGTAVYNLQLSRKDPVGTYHVDVATTVNSKPLASSADFGVAAATNGKK